MEIMTTTKLDVIWSPIHHEKFITWGSDITLYEVAMLKEIDKKTNYTQISPLRGATVVASQSGSGVRCVDVSAIAGAPDPLLALGYVNGKVALSNLKSYDPLGLAGREFVPSYSRVCNSVAWNPSETSLLATGLEKHRSDHSVHVWDVHRVPPIRDDQNSIPEPAKPLAEMSLSETVHSVSWAAAAPRTLLASTSLKYIKVIDLRDWSNKAVQQTQSRYCYGVCGDPWGWQLASRGDHVLAVWDARRLDQPVLQLPQPRPILRIQWCPTRRNLLLSLQRDATTLRLHDLQQASGEQTPASPVEGSSVQPPPASANPSTGEGGASEARGWGVLERDVAPMATAQLLSAAHWHPTHEARLLAVSHAGVVSDYTVSERVTVAWGAGTLAWSSGRGGAVKALPDSFYAALEDVSYVMRRRAHTDYGLKPDLWQNADLADDEVLSGLWHFLALSKSLVEDGCIRNSPWKHPGVRTVLRSPGDGGYRSEIVPSLLPDLPNRRVTIYRSAERTRALQLCGWGWGWENVGAGVERVEAEGTPCRAAALAAFHLRLRAALDVLARARNPQLRVVALALAGLSEERLWRESLSAAAPALPDAYLRALLHFLAASTSTLQPKTPAAGAAQSPDYSAVLNETEMRLEDRVAFACIFLSDAKLHEYVKVTGDALIEQGDLSGILLTGASTEGVSLVQRWLEGSGDVQTAALLAARCFTPDLLRDPRVVSWLDSYREILDSWKAWYARCALDTWARAGEGGATGAGGAGGRRVGLHCSYCGKSVAAPPGARPRPAFVRMPPPAAKMKQISSCPNCRKPLPRCGVCQLHLGTGAGGAAGGAGAGGAAFPAWFSWCVACRHGGHASHLIEWFKEHTECPVSSCTCHCSTLDAPDRL